MSKSALITTVAISAIVLTNLAILTVKLHGADPDQATTVTLADLQGTYAGKSIGFTSVCTNSGGCSAASPTLEVFNFAAVAQASVNATGNFCATATTSNAPVAGSAAAANISNRTISGNVTSFDATTQQGDVSFQIYEGGTCSGSTFNNTGATLTTNGTGHVVVSNSGEQIDSVATSYVTVAGDIGSVVNTVTFHKQQNATGIVLGTRP